MAILTVGVGSGFDFNTLSSAVAASQDGDVIQVQAGTYTNDFAHITTNITIEGVGGMVNLVATETPLQEKGILIIGTDGTTGPDVTLDNISFSGAAISNDDGGNGAGIRYQSGNLTLNNCDFFDNQDGMLADSDPTGTITINNSEFADNGNANPPSTGIEHNLYVDGIQQLTIDNSYFNDSIVGHDIKSRAANTTIENSRIDDPNGTGSYEIDLPNGGNAVIENNVIEKGPGAQNPNFVAFGEEGNLHANSTLTVTGNTVLNDFGAGATFVWNDTTVPASVTGNTLYGLPEDQLVNGPVGSPESNTFNPQSDEPALDTSAPYLPVLPFEFACFASGTRILTGAGEVPVEALRPGQQVIVLDAGERRVRPVKWVGWRSLDLATHPMPELGCPVRIRGGAFADGVPRRDLFLSPDHAILVDGVLIPARLLVNGGTIAQDMRLRRIRYHHVELDAHGVILAEGLPAESYLDTGNRGVFENADAPLILHPDFCSGQSGRIVRSCRPFVDDAARVEPIWRRLAARSALLGHRLPMAVATTGDPGLHLVASALVGGIMAGRAIQPASTDGGRYTFVLPTLVARARLVSRSARPCELRPWIEDRRRLGVMVSQMMLHRGAEREPIPLDHPRLSHGWWDVERDHGVLWRWTDGDAVINLCGEGPTVLEVVAAGGLDYPIGRDFAAEPGRPIGSAATHSAAA
jgi:Hint domain